MNKLLFSIKSTVGCVYRGMQEAMKNWNSRRTTRYAYYYKYCKVQENVVLYEAFYGKGMLCNPYAIFLELVNDPSFSHLKHVWVLKDVEQDSVLTEKYKDNKNVVFVKHNSKQYLKYLCTAKYLFNNSTFGHYFVKKDEQVYVNTWHGIPLKTLGYDMPNGAVESSNVVRNFLQSDYIISASPFLTEIYQRAYKLDNLFRGKIIEEGYPRLDILTRFDRETIFEKLRSYGVEVDSGKKIVLFAPTWRGTSFAHASADIRFCYEFKQRLEQIIDTSEYQILIKLHQQVFELVKDQITEGYFVPSTIDANEMLAVTDILVNDFSSIYFDFLATGRPILFYIPDLAMYCEQRGIYRSVDGLPGPCAETVDDIGNMINNIRSVQQEYQEKYDAEQRWSNGRACSGISKKIVDIVFRGIEEGYRIHYPKLEKKRILISRGKMRVNGISTSLLSFLDNLDYEKFDVTLMLTSTSVREELQLMERINPNVRILCRNAGNSMTLGERILQIYYSRTDYHNVFHCMYARDVKRSYGNAEFDYFLDFDGYNTYYAILGLQLRNAYKCIWQHNDMMAEKEARFDWLVKVFGLYKHFDKLVSCAYDVMLVNREKLAPYCSARKFGYMKNFIDIKRIEDSCGQDVARSYQGKNYIAVRENINGACISAVMLPRIPETDENGQRNYRFVTVGRSSVEKNHENLIQAFHKLYQENPNVYLYMLGDGKLKKQTDGLIESLNLGSHIFAPGNIDNPFAVLENCDCFILPSLHEGQPMVINEARVLKMPIIVSNFSSVNGILVDDGQLVIETSVDAIYEGMKKYIQGEVPANYQFDANVYNREAYCEFLNVLGE